MIVIKRKLETYVNEDSTIYDFVSLMTGQCKLEDLDPEDPYGHQSKKLQKKLTDKQKKEFNNKFQSLEKQLLIDAKNTNNFPKHTGKFDVADPIRKEVYSVYSYRISDLIIWISNNYDIDVILPDWVTDYLINRKPKSTKSNIDGFVQINTLPKIMQFMIECFQDPTLQRDTVEHKDLKRKPYLAKMEEKLNPIAIKKGISYTKNLKRYTGLTGINLEKFCEFMQKDKI